MEICDLNGDGANGSNGKQVCAGEWQVCDSPYAVEQWQENTTKTGSRNTQSTERGKLQNKTVGLTRSEVRAAPACVRVLCNTPHCLLKSPTKHHFIS